MRKSPSRSCIAVLLLLDQPLRLCVSCVAAMLCCYITTPLLPLAPLADSWCPFTTDSSTTDSSTIPALLYH